MVTIQHSANLEDLKQLGRLIEDSSVDASNKRQAGNVDGIERVRWAAKSVTAACVSAATERRKVNNRVASRLNRRLDPGRPRAERDPSTLRDLEASFL